MITVMKNNDNTFNIFIKSYDNYYIHMVKNKNVCKLSLIDLISKKTYSNIRVFNHTTYNSNGKFVRNEKKPNCPTDIFNIFKDMLYALYNNISFEQFPDLYSNNKRLMQTYPIFIFYLKFSSVSMSDKFILLYKSYTVNKRVKYIYNQFIKLDETYEFMKQNKWAVMCFMSWLFHEGFLFRFWKKKKYKVLFDNIEFIYLKKIGKLDYPLFPNNYDQICVDMSIKTYIDFHNCETKMIDENQNKDKKQYKDNTICSQINKYGTKIKTINLQKFINKEDCLLPFVSYTAKEFNPNVKEQYPSIHYLHANLETLSDQYLLSIFKYIFKKIKKEINKNQSTVETQYIYSIINPILTKYINIIKQDKILNKHYLAKLIKIKLELLTC